MPSETAEQRVSGLAYRHQRVQRLRRLVGRRSARKDEGRFVIEGVNLLEEALDAQVPIEAVYLDSEWALGPGAPAGENIGGAGPKIVAGNEPGGPERLEPPARPVPRGRRSGLRAGAWSARPGGRHGHAAARHGHSRDPELRAVRPWVRKRLS